MNKYTVYYQEYKIEKYMDCFVKNTTELVKSLEYWIGAYAVEFCSAPIIYKIIRNDKTSVLEKYIKDFNTRSKEITSNSLPEMDNQDMFWAKPARKENDYFGGIQ